MGLAREKEDAEVKAEFEECLKQARSLVASQVVNGGGV